MNLRAVAARCVYQVVYQGRSLSDVFDDKLEPRDRAFLQALVYGVCRSYAKLDKLLSLLMEKPLKAKDRDVACLICVGLYQLSEMRTPSFAAVSETVNAVRDIKKVWAKNLVNALLRSYQRNQIELDKKVMESMEGRYAHPSWWIEKIKTEWPEHWEAILKENRMHPPFALRVNERKITREAYLEKIKTVSDAFIIPETRSGMMVSEPQDVTELPGFLAGEVSVQDGAAQLAVDCLQLSPGLRVLDACAAPGGKAMHMLEKEPSITLLALDRDSSRVKLIEENGKRLSLSLKTVCADAVKTAAWWDGEPFDRILLDAPCTGSGVIRRHPDILWLRTSSDIENVVKEQAALLSALWPLLKPGGLLLYATCSIFKEENVLQIEAFLKSHSDAKEDKINASWGVEEAVGRQILPGMHGMDGFYYACLRKC